MENVRKYRNVKFKSNPLKVKKLILSPFFDECEIIEESTNPIENKENCGIVMLEMKQKVLKLK